LQQLKEDRKEGIKKQLHPTSADEIGEYYVVLDIQSVEMPKHRSLKFNSGDVTFTVR
jgi:hypothetical protein